MYQTTTNRLSDPREDRIATRTVPLLVKMLNGQLLSGDFRLPSALRVKDVLNCTLNASPFISLSNATDGKRAFETLLIYMDNISWVSPAIGPRYDPARGDREPRRVVEALVKLLHGQEISGQIYLPVHLRDGSFSLPDERFHAVTSARDEKREYPLLLVCRESVAWIAPLKSGQPPAQYPVAR